MKLKNWVTLHDSLVQMRVPFHIEKTTREIKFFHPFTIDKCDTFLDMTNNNLPISELNFIKQVKAYCNTLELHYDIDREQIKYIDTIRIYEGLQIENVYEVDLNSAYWNFAYKEGIISKDIYEKGLTVSKPTRLAALGALAKNVYKWNFDGKQWHISKPVEGEKANYFFRCCQLTGEIMNELKYVSGSDFIFFWVDAILFKPSSLHLIEQYLQLNELPYKKHFCEKIKVENGLIKVYSEDWKREKENKGKRVKNPREFFIKKNNFDLLTT